MSQIAVSPTTLVLTKPRRKDVGKKIVLYVLMVLVALFSVGPFLWILATSFKGSANDPIYGSPPPLLPAHPTLDNYSAVFTIISWDNIWNSLLIGLGGTFLNLLFCSMAAYPLARYEFPGKRIVMALLLTVILLPLFTSLVVNFLTIKAMGLTDNLLGVIIPTAVTPFGIFLLRQGYLVVPKELEDAGRVDGSSEFRIWWQLILPLVGPSLATLGVFSFVENWNSFLWPLIALPSGKNYPLTVALQQLANSPFNHSDRNIAAGAVISIVPILVIFLFAQRFFISGVTAGSVKG